MTAIFKREMKAYFISPIGYIFVAVFLLVSGGIFSYCTIQQGADSDVNTYFLFIIFTFIVLIPLLTMRSLSEERKTKTEQMLLTAPVSLTGIIVAKFLAAFTIFALTLLVSSFNFIVLYMFGTPNTVVLVGNLISILLIGSAFIAIGIFISALTENQLTAAIITIGTILLLLVSGLFNGYLENLPVLRYILNFLSIFSRFSYFTYGLFDIAATIYYFSISVIFIFLTVRIYEARRWQ